MAVILPVREEQLKEHLGDRFRELDIPLLVEWPDGQREALLFLIEEESQTYRFSIHRLGHYCLDLSEMLNTNRLVPVVIFLRGGNYPKRLQLGSENQVFLDFHYLDYAFKAQRAEDHLESDNIVARLNLANMKYPKAMKIDIYAAAVRGLMALEPNPNRQRKYIDFIDDYAQLDEVEWQQYQRRYPAEVDKMRGFVERIEEQLAARVEAQLAERIEAQLSAKLLQQGKAEGKAEILLRLMEKKFGDIPPSVKQSIEQSNAKMLDAWSERILTANHPDDVVH